jgi:periplasmic divalent cation tolerance protein
MSFIIVQTTCGSEEEAKNIATVLIEKKLAACIHISECESIYEWESKIHCDKEKVLKIKTSNECYVDVERIIKENHSYDLPEILQFHIAGGSKEYFEWLGENINE